MFKTGDEVKITTKSREAPPYSITTPGSVGVITGIYSTSGTSVVYVVKFSKIASGRYGYSEHKGEVDTFRISGKFLELNKTFTTQELVCLKIKEMEARKTEKPKTKRILAPTATETYTAFADQWLIETLI